MKLTDVELYLQDLKKIAEINYPWEKIKNKTIMISGAGGMIGSFLIDTLMYKNKFDNLNCTIIALGRSLKKAEVRFKEYFNNKYFKFVQCDINEGINIDCHKVHFIFHAASNTHPIAYAAEPVSTITTNIIGTNNLLKFAFQHETECFIFASSVEVYGENRGDTEKFREDYCGYIDCNTLRAGYTESKRAGEALCQAYIKEKGLNIVIPRLARTFGPTMLMSDSKAISQFIKKAVADENIVLKSEGNQYYSYTYAADAVSGILACLFYGKSGEAYNISSEKCNITLKDLAYIIAKYVNKEVVFDIPELIESQGYSKATKAILDNKKIQSLGWKANYEMEEAIERTIDMLRYFKE